MRPLHARTRRDLLGNRRPKRPPQRHFCDADRLTRRWVGQRQLQSGLCSDAVLQVCTIECCIYPSGVLSPSIFFFLFLVCIYAEKKRITLSCVWWHIYRKAPKEHEHAQLQTGARRQRWQCRLSCTCCACEALLMLFVGTNALFCGNSARHSLPAYALKKKVAVSSVSGAAVTGQKKNRDRHFARESSVIVEALGVAIFLVCEMQHMKCWGRHPFCS